MTRTRGFTLIELVLALTVSVALLGVAAGILRSVGQLAERHRLRAQQQATVRAAALALQREWSPLAAGPGTSADLLEWTPRRLRYRAARGFGRVCETAPGVIWLEAVPGWLLAARRPEPGRDRLLLLAAEPGSIARWNSVGISRVAPARCGSFPAWRIDLASEAASLEEAAAGTPVAALVQETIEVALYASEGRWWLGARSVSGSDGMQPVAGPLAADGLRLQLLAGTGEPVATLPDARAVQVTLRAESAQPRGSGATLVDSLVTTIAFRNRAP